MLYNNIVFLSDNLELSCEKPQNLLAEVKYNGSENFGNYHTSYFPIEKNGKELVFNGWSLKEFYINRQWSKSYLLKYFYIVNQLVSFLYHLLLSNYHNEVFLLNILLLIFLIRLMVVLGLVFL